jgi:hypothetical protein
MKNLKDVLAQYSAEGPRFGDGAIPLGGTAPAVSPTIQSLKADLEAIRKRNTTYFVCCFVLLVLLFGTCFVLVIFALRNPTLIQSALAATGLSFFGIVAQMLKLWKEKVASDLTLALIADLKPENIPSVLGVILTGLR